MGLNICNLQNYAQERHKIWNDTQVCDWHKDEGEESIDNQKLLKIYNLVLWSEVWKIETYGQEWELAVD